MVWEKDRQDAVWFLNLSAFNIQMGDLFPTSKATYLHFILSSHEEKTQKLKLWKSGSQQPL